MISVYGKSTIWLIEENTVLWYSKDSTKQVNSVIHTQFQCQRIVWGYHTVGTV